MKSTIDARLADSYAHYRMVMGLGIFGAIYRAIYFEARGCEPPQKKIK